MKKNFIYLLLLFSIIAQAQVTPSYPTIKLTKTVEGAKQDSLLVIGTDKTVKHIPYSKISSVQEFATASALPVTGIAGKIYITKDNNKIYTWNGAFYSEFVGAKGEKGDQGLQGFKGDTGAKGDTGSFNGDLTADQVTETATRKFQTPMQSANNDANSPIQGQLNSKEPTFSKNTAFNKNFGNTAVTVAEGNDSRINNGQTAYSWGNHNGKYPAYNGAGASGAWDVTSSNSNKWAGLSYSGEIQTEPVVYLLTRDGNTDTYKRTSAASIQAFLGLGNNAYNSTSYEPSFAKSTAFNKNFGNTVNTVVEGNDNRVNNGQTAFNWGSHLDKYYSRINSTALLDCNLQQDGVITGFKWTNAPVDGIASLKTTVYSPDWIEQTFTSIGSVADSWTRTRYNGTTWSSWLLNWSENNFNPNLKVDKVTGKSLISDTEITRLSTVVNQDISGKFDKTGGTISGNVNVTGTVTASPATLPNHAVVKSQLDAAVGNSTSGDFSATATNMVNVADFFINSATYTKIGNIVNAYVSISINPSATGKSTFNLPLPIARQQTSNLAIGSGSGSTYNNIIPIYILSNSTTTALVTLYSPPPTNISINIHFQYDITK